MSKDNEVLKFVIRYKTEHNGNSPSYDQIVGACGVWKSQVRGILAKLEKNGLLESEGTRGIQIPNSRWSQEAE